MLQIKTNNQPRDLLYFHELNALEKSQVRWNYDWMEERDLETNYGFFKYQGRIEHLQNFTRIEEGPNAPYLKDWDGYASHTYFDGIVVKITPDCDQVICGRYLVCS